MSDATWRYRDVVKLGRQLCNGVISPAEFHLQLLIVLMRNRGASTALAPDLVAAFPESARAALRESMTDVLRPDFLSPGWARRHEPAEPEEEVAGGLRAWARVLLAHLGEEPSAR